MSDFLQHCLQKDNGSFEIARFHEVHLRGEFKQERLFTVWRTDLGKEYICVRQDEMAIGKLLVVDGTTER